MIAVTLYLTRKSSLSLRQPKQPEGILPQQLLLGIRPKSEFPNFFDHPLRINHRPVCAKQDFVFAVGI